MALGDLLKKALSGVRDEAAYGSYDYETEATPTDPYAAAIAEQQAANRKSRIPQIASMLGGALQGKDVGEIAEKYQEKGASSLEDAIARLDAARKREKEDTTASRDTTRFEREGIEWDQQQEERKAQDEVKRESRDPTSQTSARAQEIAKQLMPSRDFTNMSAEAIERELAGTTGSKLLEQRMKIAGDERAAELAQLEHERKMEIERLKQEGRLEEERLKAGGKAKPETTEQKEMAKRAAENFATSQEAAQDAPGKIATIDTMISMLEGPDAIQTGPVVGNTPGYSLFPEHQRFEQLSAELQLGASDQLKGVLSDSDMKLLKRSVANTTTDEATNLASLKQARTLLEKAQQEATRQREYYNARGTMEGYVPSWAAEATTPEGKTVVRRSQQPDGTVIVQYSDGTFGTE